MTSVLCCLFLVFSLAGERAGILAFGFGIAVDQLDDRHRRIVAVAIAGLDDARIAAGPGGVTLGENRQQLVGERLILQLGDRQPPGMQPAALAERDQPLDDRPQILGLGQRGADLLVLEEGGGEVLEHRLPVGGGAAEAAMAHPMAHYSVSRTLASPDPSWPGLTRPSTGIPGSSPGMTGGGGLDLNRAHRSAWPALRCFRAARRGSPCPNGGPY